MMSTDTVDYEAAIAAVEDELSGLRVQVGDAALAGRDTAALRAAERDAEDRRAVLVAEREAAGRAGERAAVAEARGEVRAMMVRRLRLDAESMRRREAVVKAELALARARAELDAPAPESLDAHGRPPGVARNVLVNTLLQRGHDEKNRLGAAGEEMMREIHSLPACPSVMSGGRWVDERMAPRELAARAKEFEALADQIEEAGAA